ncbi:hypothetical protein ACJX0J_033759, partial [Zea mays]
MRIHLIAFRQNHNHFIREIEIKNTTVEQYGFHISSKHKKKLAAQVFGEAQGS